jgi:hypothetical protein
MADSTIDRGSRPEQNWDIDGLKQWVNYMPIILQGQIAESHVGVLKPLLEGNGIRWFTPSYVGSIVAVIFNILITLLIVLDVETAYEITNLTSLCLVLFGSSRSPLLEALRVEWEVAGGSVALASRRHPLGQHYGGACEN